MKRDTFFTGLLAVHAVGLLATSSMAAAPSLVAYRGAAIETVAKAGRIEQGVVLIRDGKIEAVGKDVKIPETARVIDASGDTIMPGIVDPYHVVPIGRSSSLTRQTITIGGVTFTIGGRPPSTSTAFVRVADGFDPTAVRWGPAVRSGITTANLVTQGYGQSARAALTPDDVEAMLTEPDGHLFMALTNQTSSLDVLRNGLRGRTSRSGASSGGRSAASSSSGATRPPTSNASGTSTSSSRSTTSPATPLWQQVREGKQPLIVNVNNAATILHLVKTLEAHKNTKVIMVTSGPNLFQTLQRLKGTKISVILQPQIDLVPDSADRVNMARLVDAAKVRFAFSLSLSQREYSESQDTPLFRLALMVRSGLAREQALRALTLTPATMLGIEKQVGSIESGKAANLIICDGDPFATATRFRQVLVDGRPVYEG